MPHLAVLRRLPFHHRDPFDRLIIAQAMAEGLPVVSRDAAFAPCSVDVLWDEA
jgi:PIN domain nuclease of toxin-antitoxin system